MSTAITKKIEELKEKHSATLSRTRERAQAAAKAQQHTLTALAASYTIGAMEKRGVNLPTVKNIDAKLVYGVAALAMGFMVKDAKQRAIAQSVGDGLLSIVAYNQARGQSAFSAGAIVDQGAA